MTPIRSHNDQLLITGVEPLTLHNLFASVQTILQSPKKPHQQHMVFTIMRPFAFHVTRLARQLSETITGDFARRHPLNETAVNEFLSSLTLLHSIHSFVLDPEELEKYPAADPLFYLSPQMRSNHINLRACAHILTLGRATLVLALHRELSRRASLAATGTPDPWAAERLDLLSLQTREMAGFALEEVARGLQFLSSLPHITHLQRGGLIAWGQFCLEEADVVGGATPERAAVIETISDALKLVGYSWALPTGLVERLDAYVGTDHASAPSFADDSLLLDMFPAPLGRHSWMFIVPDLEQGFTDEHR
ncbi:hypothetical protein C8R43DRAFT_1187697 [Mycena crocata]|nr:hypothetical protein C8R43DRAFT_1187697 [Mycena crocata]